VKSVIYLWVTDDRKFLCRMTENHPLKKDLLRGLSWLAKIKCTIFYANTQDGRNLFQSTSRH